MVESYIQTELGIIPNEWRVKSLGDVGAVKMCKRVFNNQTKPTGAIPFYKIGTFGKEPDAFISEGLFKSYKQKFSFPKKGDILISASGTIGRTVVYDGRPAYFQDSNIIWIDNNETIVSNEYLYYVYQIADYSTEGGTIQRLYNDIIKNTKFICPPKTEQTTIATALNDVDKLINELVKLISKKKLLKDVVQQSLMSGKKRLGGFREKWVEVTIASLCKTFTKQTGFDYSAFIKPKLVTTYQNGVIPFIQNKDFNCKKINFNTDYFIPENVAKDFPKIVLDEKCLLISISGSIGNVALFCNSQKAFLGGAIAVAKFMNKAHLDWVLFYLLSRPGQDVLLKNVKSGAHHNLILDDLRKITIPLPSTEEQFAIVKILTDIDSEIESLENKLDKYIILKQGMMQNLLTGKIRLV